MRKLTLVAAAFTLTACGGTDSGAASDALDGISSAYEQLAESIASESGEAVDWAREDLENLGDWEYRIVDLGSSNSQEMEVELNEFGNERWEAWWVQPTGDGVRIYLKRSSFSVAGRVPVSALLRALTAGGSQ